MGTRKVWIFVVLLALFGGLVSFGACVPPPPSAPSTGDDDDTTDDDDDTTTGTPTATDEPTPSPGATLPNFDMADGSPNYTQDILSFVNGGSCNCHTGGSGGFRTYANPSPAQMYNGYLSAVCCPRAFTYDNPAGEAKNGTTGYPGRLMTYFCDGPGSPNNSIHNNLAATGASFSAGQCTTMYNWFNTGAGGSPANCFGTAEPDCPAQQ